MDGVTGTGQHVSGEEPLVLSTPRRKILPMFAGATVFVAVGLLMVVSDNPLGWFVIAFFGACLVVFGWQMVTPSQLRVTPTSVQLRHLWRRKEWDLVSCGEFGVWGNSMAGQPIVVFDHHIESGSRLGRANRALAGGSASLPETFGMDASKLANLLNEARRSALQRAKKN